jgi:hypothetical protein
LLSSANIKPADDTELKRVISLLADATERFLRKGETLVMVRMKAG